MDTTLYDWLKYQWRISNHPKYQHYFEEWIDNITPSQTIGFYNNMKADYVNHNK